MPDSTDSLAVHPPEPTLADVLAFEAWPERHRNLAKSVLRAEIEQSFEREIEYQEGENGRLERQLSEVHKRLDYLRGEGIERIYKNDKGFWLYPKNTLGGITYDSYKSSGPFKTLEDAINAGTQK